MSTRRKFNFALSTLTHAAERLHGALTDADYSADMATRLGSNAAADLATATTAVTGKAVAQGSKTGDLSNLTAGQRTAFDEMQRLTSGARRSARLAFPGQQTVLREEFQVGEADSQSLAAILDRAGKTKAACIKYAAQLANEGWIAADTTALADAITALSGVDDIQEEAKDDRKGLTSEKVGLANTLYDLCLRVQNAARLQYPAKTDADGNALNVTARARFLLDEFPPRDRSQPDGGTQGGGDGPGPA